MHALGHLAQQFPQVHPHALNSLVEVARLVLALQKLAGNLVRKVPFADEVEQMYASVDGNGKAASGAEAQEGDECGQKHEDDDGPHVG